MELHCLLDAFFAMSFSIHFWRWSMENHLSETEVQEEEEGEEDGEGEEEDVVQGNQWTQKWVSGTSEEKQTII